MERCITIGIGVNEYQDAAWATLHNCQLDINNIIEILTARYGISTPELLFGSEQTTKSGIYNRIYDIVINCPEDQSILLIFAGHGIYNSITNTTFWIPSDGLKRDASTWLDLDTIIKMMRASAAKHISLIVDACYSGGILSEPSRGGGLQAFSSKRSRLALTSGSLENVSDGIAGQGSPFANTLVHVLDENTASQITFLDICSLAIQSFAGDRQQTPKMGAIQNTGHDGGAFVFTTTHTATGTSLYRTQETILPVKIKPDITFEHDCVVPQFISTKQLDFSRLNFRIQKLAYGAIDGARDYYDEYTQPLNSTGTDRQYTFQLGYHIELTTEHIVSLTISVYHEFGGPHPYFAILPLNYSLDNDADLAFDETVDHSGYETFENFINAMIRDHSYDKEQQEVLSDYAQYITPSNIEFYLSPSSLIIEFFNQLPFAARAFGELKIPRSALTILV